MINVLLLLFFSICGTLHSVDQFLNIKMTDISVTDPDKYPHMVCIRLASAFRVHKKSGMHLYIYSICNKQMTFLG